MLQNHWVGGNSPCSRAYLTVCWPQFCWQNKIEDPVTFAKGKYARVFPKWLQCSLPSNCDFVILWQSFPRYWYAIKKIQSLSYSHLAIETTETLMLALLFCLKLATLPVRIKIICCTFDSFCDNVSSWNICLICTHTISWKHHFSKECCSQSQFTLRSKLNCE